jgi:hypothetical protein
MADTSERNSSAEALSICILKKLITGLVRWIVPDFRIMYGKGGVAMDFCAGLLFVVMMQYGLMRQGFGNDGLMRQGEGVLETPFGSNRNSWNPFLFTPPSGGGEYSPIGGCTQGLFVII